MQAWKIQESWEWMSELEVVVDSQKGLANWQLELKKFNLKSHREKRNQADAELTGEMQSIWTRRDQEKLRGTRQVT